MSEERRGSVAESLAWEAARLQEGRAAGRATLVRGRAITVGIGESMEGPVARSAHALGWQVLRRSTGGTGVAHVEGDVLWSLILPRSDPRVGRDFSRAYARLGRPVTDALEQLGVRASWAPSRGLSTTYCLLGERGWALEVDGRVVGGAAQHLTRSALLHHGTLSLSVPVSVLEPVFEVSPAVTGQHLGALGDLGLRAASATLVAEVERELVAFAARVGP